MAPPGAVWKPSGYHLGSVSKCNGPTNRPPRNTPKNKGAKVSCFLLFGQFFFSARPNLTKTDGDTEIHPNTLRLAMLKNASISSVSGTPVPRHCPPEPSKCLFFQCFQRPSGFGRPPSRPGPGHQTSDICEARPWPTNAANGSGAARPLLGPAGARPGRA